MLAYPVQPDVSAWHFYLYKGECGIDGGKYQGRKNDYGRGGRSGNGCNAETGRNISDRRKTGLRINQLSGIMPGAERRNMAFFVTAVSGLWGLKIKLSQVLKMPDTGRKRTVHDITCRGIPP